MKHIAVMTTVSRRDEATRTAHSLVERKLAGAWIESESGGTWRRAS